MRVLKFPHADLSFIFLTSFFSELLQLFSKKSSTGSSDGVLTGEGHGGLSSKKTLICKPMGGFWMPVLSITIDV
jgi:hypothetical protein